MNIIVCVKQTPETAEVELSIDESGRKIKTDNLVFELNEWDEYAIEEALLLKEKLGGTVTAVTVGPEGADAVLRRCLAKGADSALWLNDEAFNGSDAYATAKILHDIIKDQAFDLILCGAQASDDGYSAVGVMLAELLGINHASMVKKIGFEQDSIKVNRELEGGLEEILKINLPALLTIQTGINEPRYVSIMGIRRARKKEIKIIGLDHLNLTREDVGEQGSWLTIEKIYRPPTEKECIMISGNPDDVATKFLEIIKSRGLI